MTKKSSDQDIELKSLKSNKSNYENNPSEYDINEDDNTKNLENLLDQSDNENENETTPFIVDNNSEQVANSDIKNRKKELDGNEAETETFLNGNETNLNPISPAEEETPENPNTLVNIENGTTEPDKAESLVVRLITIAKSNIALLLSIFAIFLGILFAVLILPNSIFSIEYDKVNVL